MKKKAILISCLLLVFTLVSCKSGNSINIQYTLDQYNYIQPGMNINEVTDILGLPTENLSQTKIDNITSEVKSWKNKDGSNILLTFTDDDLISKAQSGLKIGDKGLIRLGEAMATKKNTVNFKDFPVSNTLDNVTLKVEKLSQTSNYLELNLTAQNNTDKQITIDYFSTRLFYNGNYRYYDTKFDATIRVPNKIQQDNEMYLNAKSSINLVLFLKPINADKVNIYIQTMGDDIKAYEFNNVQVLK